VAVLVANEQKEEKEEEKAGEGGRGGAPRKFTPATTTTTSLHGARLLSGVNSVLPSPLSLLASFAP